ncbi:MAG: hypothetical protein LBP35_02955 [Candidatus Ancillula trichonymphae]|nr:hypothetical protein [Candidatus Ancillula trichonymphae]
MSSSLDYGYLAQYSTPAFGSLPSQYNLKVDAPDGIGEVRNQHDTRTCWAFAITSALASNLKARGLKKNTDLLSPRFLVNSTYNNDTFINTRGGPIGLDIGGDNAHEKLLHFLKAGELDLKKIIRFL